MSKKKKQTAKRQTPKWQIKINWQKWKWPLTLTCVGIALVVFISLLVTVGYPVKQATSPNERIAVQMRWKGFGRYVAEYTVITPGKDVEVNLNGVRRLVDVQFTASSRYAMFVYKGAQSRQYFYVVDYLTGSSGFVDPALIFNTEVPSRQDISNIKVTFQEMDPEFDAVIFRVDYKLANGEKHYEHITYDIKTDHLQ